MTDAKRDCRARGAPGRRWAAPRCATSSAGPGRRSCSSTASRAPPSNWVELAPLLARRHRLLIVRAARSRRLRAAPRGAHARPVRRLRRRAGPARGAAAGAARRPLARRRRRAACRRAAPAATSRPSCCWPRRGSARRGRPSRDRVTLRAARAARPRGRAVSDVDRRDSLGAVARVRPLAGRRSAGALGRGDGGVPRRAGASHRRPAGRAGPSGRTTSASASTACAARACASGARDDRMVPLARRLRLRAPAPRAPARDRGLRPPADRRAPGRVRRRDRAAF